MKIFRDNCVYVQLEDINYIINRNISCPRNLIHRTIEQGYVFIDEKNKYNFIGYNEKNIVDFFKGLDFIINYDEIKDLTNEELNDSCQNYINDKEALLEEYNYMSPANKRNIEDIISHINDLEYKYYQISKFLLYKKGNDNLVLPKGVDYPKKDNIFKKIFKKKN